MLREGNSDRRPAASVKKFAQKHPHRMMRNWPTSGSQARVAHMHEKDFYANETSVTVDDPVDVRIEFVPAAGTVTVLRDKVPLLASEVIDAAVMNVAALRRFYAKTIEEAQSKGVLLSLHLKATMMKVSDSVMFGHCVAVYYQAALDKHSDTLKETGPTSTTAWPVCWRNSTAAS